jgi:hypothetical protein
MNSDDPLAHAIASEIREIDKNIAEMFNRQRARP